jgi:hypothetical protein
MIMAQFYPPPGGGLTVRFWAASGYSSALSRDQGSAAPVFPIPEQTYPTVAPAPLACETH